MNSEHKKTQAFEQVLDAYVSRRGFLRNASSLGAAALASSCAISTQESTSQSRSDLNPPASLGFKELDHTIDESFSVPEGYQSQVLVRWGDAIFDGVEAFDPRSQTAKRQLQSFGYNNDFIGFVPLPLGSQSSEHGLLVVNHEYTIPELMFPGSPKGQKLSREQVDVDIAAHGLSVVEIKQVDGVWQRVTSSQYNRRITPDTPMQITGAAAGNPRLQSIISKDGVHTLGTYGNCAGGVTPWGTILTGEENVDGFFSGDYKSTDEADNYERFGMFKRYKNWGEYIDRWNLDKNPHELLHMGWIVEIDPYDPQSKPKKRTTLGRYKHEGCNVFINDDGHVVAYSGDDQKFEYIYKFVSKNKYDKDNRAANLDLLEEGTLYVAQFKEDGTLQWQPLVYGQGPLTEKNNFASQGDVYIDARRAADLMAATPMDRPEDVEVNPVTGKVYAMLTNNSDRKADDLNPANPRPHNKHGQIIEFWPENGDHSDQRFRWELFLLAGDPKKTVALYHPDTSDRGWLSCPDNCAFDRLGNLWICSDGAQHSGIADGMWATEVSGSHRGLTKRFMRIPIGAEMCGPFFTPDSENLFCSVQHPASGSSYDKPSTRWPDFSDDMPPRPAVMVTRKIGGGRIGS